MFKSILNPDLYHGENKKDKYFEGWYFKLTDSKKQNVFSFIPGIYKDRNPHMEHSFIQVLQGNEAKCEYLRYDASEFIYNKNILDINIHGNNFTIDGMDLNISQDNISVSGSIRFTDAEKWPDSVLNPGSMGFYNYLLFMECYSQVCLVTGNTQGELIFNNKKIDFNGGKVYIEKNWGRAFPRAWIWIQSNSFDSGEAALSCSVGRVPFPLGDFNGFLAGFMIGKEFYRFTSMNRSKMEVSRQKDDVSIKLCNHKYELDLSTESEEDKFILLMGPASDGMVPMVRENLKGRVKATLKDIQNDALLFTGTGSCTGIEYGGEWKNFNLEGL